MYDRAINIDPLFVLSYINKGLIFKYILKSIALRNLY